MSKHCRLYGDQAEEVFGTWPAGLEARVHGCCDSQEREMDCPQGLQGSLLGMAGWHERWLVLHTVQWLINNLACRHPGEARWGAQDRCRTMSHLEAQGYYGPWLAESSMQRARCVSASCQQWNWQRRNVQIALRSGAAANRLATCSIMTHAELVRLLYLGNGSSVSGPQVLAAYAGSLLGQVSDQQQHRVCTAGGPELFPPRFPLPAHAHSSPDNQSIDVLG